jgi:GMP synthase PP-ATPase subunit
MTDIVDELRSHFSEAGIIKSATSDLVKKAADEIERLRNVAQGATEPPFLESLRKTAKVMKKAHDAGGYRWMSIWQEDLQAVEEAIAALSSAERAEGQ